MFSKFAVKIAVFSLLLTFPLIVFSKKIENKRINTASKNLVAAATAPRQNEMLVIGALKQLYTAEATYFTTNSPNVWDRRFGSLLQLYAANLIDAVLGSGEKYGYTFIVQTGYESGAWYFRAYARPKTYRKTGIRSFYFDARCTIRGGDKGGANASVEDAVIDTCTPTLAYDNEKQVILAMRTLVSAQETYKATVGNGNYATTFTALHTAGLINSWLASGTYYDYYFSLQVNQPFPPFPGQFKFSSVPDSYGQMGFRSFYIDQTGVLRGADHQGGEPSENDPPIVENNKEEK